MTAIDGWENFYVIVGSSAAALTGLMFVVITLTAEIANRPGGWRRRDGCVCLADRSAFLLRPPGCGLIYTIMVVARMRRQKSGLPPSGM